MKYISNRAATFTVMTHLCISITQLDCDISFQFIFKSDSMNSRYSFDYCRLSMGYMTNCTCVLKGNVC